MEQFSHVELEFHRSRFEEAKGEKDKKKRKRRSGSNKEEEDDLEKKTGFEEEDLEMENGKCRIYRMPKKKKI